MPSFDKNDLIGVKPLVATSLDIVIEKLCHSLGSETISVPESDSPVLDMTDRIYRKFPKVISRLETDYEYVVVPSPPMMANIDPADYDLRFIVMVHDLPAIDDKGFLGSKVKKDSLRSLSEVDMVLAMSEETKNDLIRHTSGLVDVNNLNIEVLTQGVDRDRIYPDETQPSVYLPEKYILYVGAFQDRKNPEFLLDVLQELPESYELVCCGDYLDENRFNEFLEYARKKDTRSRVHDLGYVSLDDLRRIYSNAEVYLHPARFEGFGRTPVEAAICGTKPIMYEKVPAARELGEECLKFDEFHSDQVAELVMEKPGKPISYQHKSWKKSASDLIKLVDKNIVG